jgi:hypothetical protein
MAMLVQHVGCAVAARVPIQRKKANRQSESGLLTSSEAPLYMYFGSKKTIGFGSRADAKSSPLAWIGLRGTTTFTPGVCAK